MPDIFTEAMLEGNLWVVPKDTLTKFLCERILIRHKKTSELQYVFLSDQRHSSVKWMILLCEILFFSPNQAWAERTKCTLTVLECMRCTYSHRTIFLYKYQLECRKKCLQSFVLCAHLLCIWCLVSATTQNSKRQQQWWGFWDRTVPISVSPRHLHDSCVGSHKTSDIS